MASISDTLNAAVRTAASGIAERESDGSFLEEALRTALEAALPQTVRREQKLGMTSWPKNLGGVDLLWHPTHTKVRVGIETKVTDVQDSLYDIFKLAGGIAEGAIDIGAVVVAGTERNWASGGLVAAMTQPLPPGAQGVLWSTRDVLQNESDTWSRTWSKSAARPIALPRSFVTQALPLVPMPLASLHEVRVVMLRAADSVRLSVNSDGTAGDDQLEHAWLDPDLEKNSARFERETMSELARRAGIEWSVDDTN